MAKDNSKLSEGAEVKRIQVDKLDTTVIQCAECGAEVDRVEHIGDSDVLIDQILSKSVQNRAKDTYKCRNGHNGDLEIR